jgi:hypothetical protein
LRLRTERDRPYRAYCRVAAAAFALVVVYTLLVKLLEGELGGDWMHTALHVATGAAAVYAGWFAARAVAAKAFMLGLGAAYGALGIGGWFEDGLLMDSAFRIPLGPQDNLFLYSWWPAPRSPRSPAAAHRPRWAPGLTRNNVREPTATIAVPAASPSLVRRRETAPWSLRRPSQSFSFQP